MAYIETIAEEDAGGRTAEVYAADREVFGGAVPNLTRAFSLRPDVYAAWRGLNGAIKANMDLRRYELVTLAAAKELRSSYCMLAHGEILAEQFDGPDAVRALVDDPSGAGLDEVDAAVMELAAKVARDAGSVQQADVDRLRALGLSDADVLDVVAAASARCFFSTALDALGAEPDARFADLEPPELRDALTVGRPIAAP
jgi:uncharacterized peroxidase-related enzyme